MPPDFYDSLERILGVNLVPAPIAYLLLRFIVDRFAKRPASALIAWCGLAALAVYVGGALGLTLVVVPFLMLLNDLAKVPAKGQRRAPVDYRDEDKG